MDKQTNIPGERRAGYSGLYLERSGIDARVLAEELVRAPERPLSEEEKAEARRFEADTLAAHVTESVTLEDVLKIQVSGSAVAPLFFGEELRSGEVQVEGVDMPEFLSSEEAYRWVATSKLDKKQLMELSRKSTEAYKKRAAEALIEGRPIDESITDSRPIVLDPEGFSEKIHAIDDARAMLLDYRRTAPKGAAIDDAKNAYTDIFLAKINAQLAAGIPIIAYLRDQAELTGDSELAALADELIPAGFARAMEEDSSKQRLFRRLDFLRNGIGYNSDGKATGVSAEVQTGVAEQPRGGIYTPEQMRHMQEVMIAPEEMQQIIRRILAKAHLLSSEDDATYEPDRRRRASDGLFQVVINPGKTSFAVDLTEGVYKVSSEPRSLYDVVIVGGFHELEHINQSLADDAAEKTVKIAGIKGKRISGLREAGANMRQRQAEEALFGYRKPYMDTYAKALEALESGGSMGDAIKAFYEAKLRATPDSNKVAAAKEAADRVLRLLHGGMNSQPMSYAEESILVSELSDASPEVQRRALAVTGLDLVDQTRLHTFGLLDVPADTSIDWSEYIMEELQGYLPAEQ